MREQCEIVRDVYPLVEENLCSEATRKFVKEHLATCRECQAVLGETDSNIFAVSGNHQEAEAVAPVVLKKMKRRLWSGKVGLVVATALVVIGLGVGFVSYALTDIRFMPYEVADITVEVGDPNLAHFRNTFPNEERDGDYIYFFRENEDGSTTGVSVIAEETEIFTLRTSRRFAGFRAAVVPIERSGWIQYVAIVSYSEDLLTRLFNLRGTSSSGFGFGDVEIAAIYYVDWVDTPTSEEELFELPEDAVMIWERE